MEETHRGRWILSVVLALAVCSMATGIADGNEDRFAVIVVGEQVEANSPDDDPDDEVTPTPQELAFWNGAVLTYDMLRENGFQPENIVVLYGQGVSVDDYHPNDPNIPAMPRDPRYEGEAVADRLATKDEIETVFKCLAGTSNCGDEPPKLTETDFLFVFWTGHGHQPTDNVEFEIGNGSTHVSAEELSQWMAGMSYSKRVFLFTTCRAAGIASHFGDVATNTVLMPACVVDDPGVADSPYPTELSLPTGAVVEHFPWTYWVAQALLDEYSGIDNPDGDQNSLVSIKEADSWAKKQEPLNPMPPDITDNDEIAGCIFIRAESPGQRVQVFSRDHENDNSTVPSNTEPWYLGPDLWVRHSNDGVAVHVSPAHGVDNYVYSRVHNIGCSDLEDVNVKLSWSEVSGWCDELSWTPIGTAGPVSLAMGTSAILPPVQWSNVPIPGHYCLHSEVEVPGDMPNLHGEAYLDNNKVQVNVAVIDAVADEPAPAFFFIDNRSDDTLPIDLDFDFPEVPVGSRLVIELPPSARFRSFNGGRLRRSDDGWTVLELGELSRPGAGVVRPRSARVKGLVLPGRSRIRALVSIRVPDGPRHLRLPVEFTFSEVVNGETKGGVRFIAAQANDERRLLCRIVRTEAQILGELATALGLGEAASLAGRLESAASPERCRSVISLREAFVTERVRRELLVEAVLTTFPLYGARFASADRRLNAALWEDDIPAVVSAAQEHLLYASIILDELQRR